jgi:hypothetical protein
VKSKDIRGAFVSDRRKFGTESNIELRDGGDAHRWYHLCASVSDSVKTFKYSDIGSVAGKRRDTRNVLKRSFDEISEGAIETVRDLISQGSLYKGEEWNGPISAFFDLYKGYHAIRTKKKRENYCWVQSAKAGEALSRIKNHSIGVLLTDISEGMELNDAVKRYEKIVAPTNYKRPKAIFTKKMVEQAQKTAEELGLVRSLGRRHAVLGDITVNNILFANRDAAKQMSGNVFEELSNSVPDKQKNFGKVEEVAAKDFVRNILPEANEVELLLENDHGGNMVSLIAPKDNESRTMFKWENGFSWAYSGNITDSMKQRVKSLGGKVDGVLRFSIQWNDHGDCLDDLDAHCVEPGGNHIYYHRKKNMWTTGELDVDIINPDGVAVENITWSNLSKMKRGQYRFFVNNYTCRSGRSGFSAEVEFDGKIYSFSYDKPLRQGENVDVAVVNFDGENFEINSVLGANESSREIWGLDTNRFHQVSAIMYSPNYWDEQDGIGHRHYMFLLKGCQNPESPNGFFNEFLREDLMKHKRVFEALGAKMRVEPSDNQLSGLGFSATKRASVTCRVKGSFTRVVQITF